MPLTIYQSTNKLSNYRINIMFDFENKWNAIKQAANSDIALFKWASKVIWNFICFQSHNKTKLKPNLIAASLEFSQAWSR